MKTYAETQTLQTLTTLDKLRDRLARTRMNHAASPKPSRAAAIEELLVRIQGAEAVLASEPELVKQAQAAQKAEHERDRRRAGVLEAQKRQAAYDCHAAWAGRPRAVAWTSIPAAWHLACHLARQAGGKREHTSEGSAYYRLPSGRRLRISKHELPATDERRHNHGQGWRSHTPGCEVVLTELLTPDQVEALMDEALGDEALSERVS